MHTHTQNIPLQLYITDDTWMPTFEMSVGSIKLALFKLAQAHQSYSPQPKLCFTKFPSIYFMLVFILCECCAVFLDWCCWCWMPFFHYTSNITVVRLNWLWLCLTQPPTQFNQKCIHLFFERMTAENVASKQEWEREREFVWCLV